MGGVNIHHDLAHLAAIRKRNRRAWNRRQLWTNKVRAKVVELLFRKSLTAQSQLQDRNGRCAVTNHKWRRNSRWKLFHRRLRLGGDLRYSSIDIRLGLKVDLDDRHTIQRLRF